MKRWSTAVEKAKTKARSPLRLPQPRNWPAALGPRPRRPPSPPMSALGVGPRPPVPDPGHPWPRPPQLVAACRSPTLASRPGARPLLYLLACRRPPSLPRLLDANDPCQDSASKPTPASVAFSALSACLSAAKAVRIFWCAQRCGFLAHLRW